MSNPIIFLDLDGCLNRHKKLASGFCGCDRDLVENLNRILAEIPEAKIVFSTSWRYLIHEGHMTLNGFNTMMLTHGLNIKDRVHGYTESDEITSGKPWASHGLNMSYEEWVKFGLDVRKQQIEKYVNEFKPSNWIAIDDLNLELELMPTHIGKVSRLIKCLPNEGLTEDLTSKAIGILSYV